MGRAVIVNGVWTRNVNWETKGEWRTDIFKRTLSDPQFRYARFVLKGGPTIVVSAEELRRVLEGGRDHYGGEIWGPFNINPSERLVDGRKVQMELEA